MNKNDKADIHSGIAWAITFALAAMAFSIITMCKECPRTETDFDYLGLLVGVLSLLVAALLGWQIFNAIEMRSIIKEYDDLKSRFNVANDALAAQDMRNIELIEAFECKRQADLYQEESSISRLTIRYTALLLAVKHFLNADMLYDYGPLKDTVDKLGNVLGNIENLNQVDRSQFNRYRERLENIYDEIIIAIDRRLDEYQEIKRLIKQYHDRRIVIHQS